MEIKIKNYVEQENINKLVKCLNKDEKYLRKIPHQPGEFSSKPFKNTTTCLPNRKGDYYDYYKNSFQLETFEKNMKTPFTNVKLLKYNNKTIKIINPELSIHQNYEFIEESTKSNYNKCLLLVLPGTNSWGPFLNHVYPYIYFCKDILDQDNEINILIKKPKFDSFEYLIRNILNIKNDIIYVTNNQVISINNLYKLEVSGPFASGLFPFQAYCNVPIIFYKDINIYIRKILPDIEKNNRKNLIYTKRNLKENKFRFIKNEELIINYLIEYCKKENLNFINYNFLDYTIEKRIELFNNAAIVIGPHGSANHHVYFCNKDTKVIEFIFCKDCHNDATFSLAFDLDYWQIPVPEYGQYEKIIKISNESIQSMKEILPLK